MITLIGFSGSFEVDDIASRVSPAIVEMRTLYNGETGASVMGAVGQDMSLDAVDGRDVEFLTLFDAPVELPPHIVTPMVMVISRVEHAGMFCIDGSSAVHVQLGGEALVAFVTSDREAYGRFCRKVDEDVFKKVLSFASDSGFILDNKSREAKSLILAALGMGWGMSRTSALRTALYGSGERSKRCDLLARASFAGSGSGERLEEYVRTLSEMVKVVKGSIY